MIETIPAVLQNMGRVAMKMRDWGRAVALLEGVEDPDLNCLLALALSHERSGNLEKAYDNYRRSFEAAQTENQRSQILTAMAMVANKVHGADAAKALLLKSSQMRPPAINTLFALCVLGLRNSDPSLVSAALQEMDKYQKTDPNGDLDTHMADIISLKSLVFVLKGRQLF